MTDVRDALRAIVGVAEATVEEEDGAPVEVRIELESGADEGSVASSVQSILSSYGLRSRLAPPRVRLEPVVPPPPPTVLHAGSRGEASPLRVSPLEGVSVRQLRDQVLISVTDPEGRVSERVARPGTLAVWEAIVGAVAELLAPGSPPPGVVGVDVQSERGAEVLTVVLDVGAGSLRAGAAVVTSGRELALADAVWRALEGWPP